jgi:hypothetical protein
MATLTQSPPSEIMSRLQPINARARNELIGLYRIGHLDESILSTVLDAADLSGMESWKLPAFAISYLYLRSQGVPVADVIHMARQYGRRINPWWSARRWQEEHDRLGRYATLKMLSEKAWGYRLEYFRVNLPRSFPGYLVKTSTRLGLEGLRQRHCVASWHERIMNDMAAIAVVFVERTRWTVELIRTGSDEHPLRIGQIKGRYNRNPEYATRKRIHELLEIEDNGTSLPITGNPNARCWRENAQRIINRLEELGCTEVISVTFDGYGDSGAIDDVALGDAFADQAVEILRIERSFNQGAWTQRETTVATTLRDAIEHMAYDYISETGVNWYDNDGGFGELVLDMPNRTLALEINARYTDSEIEFARELEFDELRK